MRVSFPSLAALAGRVILPAFLAMSAGLVPQARAGGANSVSRFEAIRVLIETHNYEGALKAAAHFSKDPEVNALNVAFTKALILKNARRLPEAAARMRAILARYPDLKRVRRELAHTLYTMGETDAAAYHFERLAQGAATDRTRSLYESYIQQSRKRRPWSLSGYAGLAPSTNISNATDAETVYIGGVPFTPGESARSGIGVNYGLRGTYRFDLDSHGAVTVGAGISGTQYRDSSYATTSLEGFAEYSRRFDRWNAAVGLTVAETLKGGEPYRLSVGPTVSVRRSFGRAGTTTARLSWQARQYHQSEAYDGSETALSLHHVYAPSSASSVRFGGRLAYVSAEKDFNAYASYTLDARYFREWNFGVISDVGVEFEDREYVGDFSLMGEPRSDRRIEASIGITFRELGRKGFAPRIEYSYTRNFSNVGLYDYNRNSFAMLLTKRY